MLLCLSCQPLLTLATNIWQLNVCNLRLTNCLNKQTVLYHTHTCLLTSTYQSICSHCHFVSRVWLGRVFKKPFPLELRPFRGFMDAQQIAQLDLQSVFSLLLLILFDLARRWGLSPVPQSVTSRRSDPEVGQHPNQQRPLTPFTCEYCCAYPECKQWCGRADEGHTHHRCRRHRKH